MTNIGDTVTSNDLSLPIGISIESNGGVWVKEVDGWHNEGGTYHYPIVNQTYETGPVVALVPYTETLAMHKQRFAVTCITMGHSAGGGSYLDGARDIVERLGLPDPRHETLRIGSWVSPPVNLRRAPDGTVLLSGARDRAVGHSLYRVEGRRLHRIHGERSEGHRLLLQVVALPVDCATDDWPDVGDDEQEAIRLFRIASWEAGLEEKHNRSWCPDFEANISVLSLSEDEVERLRREGESDDPTLLPYGTMVNQSRQAACPAGAVFAYIEGDSRYLWARTDVGARSRGNIGITLGQPSVCTSSTRTSVVWDGVSPIHNSPVRDQREMELMPIGTIIGQGWHEGRFGSLWEKTEAGWQATPDGYASRPGDFMIDPLRYAYIPVPGVPRPEWAPIVLDTDDDLF